VRRYHKWFGLVALLIILVALAPMLVSMGAGLYAEHHGCILHEGAISPCVVGNVDVGKTLYSLGMLGWLGIVTLPIGAVALLVLIVSWIVATMVTQARRRRTA
jgi:hypothetical protein